MRFLQYTVQHTINRYALDMFPVTDKQSKVCVQLKVSSEIKKHLYSSRIFRFGEYKSYDIYVILQFRTKLSLVRLSL
jgi:hypothetical protein